MPKQVLSCTVNDEAAEVLVQPWDTLLDALRERMGLTGPKEGCGTGDCGACTVLLNGKPVNSCLIFSGELDGADVVFPKYDAKPLARGAVRHALFAVDAAMQRLGDPRLPVVVVGYSRGARLAVELATVLPVVGAGPSAVVSVYPVGLNPRLEEDIDLRALDHRMEVVIFTGKEDSHSGEQEMLDELTDKARGASDMRELIDVFEVWQRED